VNHRLVALAASGVLLAGPALAQHSAPASALSDPEKLQNSEEQLARMKAALKQVLGRVEDARNEKDVVKLNCVNEKLTQIKALLRVAEQADIALHEALATRDPGADSELQKIGIARTKIDALRGESEGCIGQLAYVVDERTTVEVQQPEGLPEQDVTDRKPPEAPRSAPAIVRPPPASRYY
jgi:hypothetical protein